MPRIPTYPDLFDDAIRISTSNLSLLGYLNAGKIKSGVITWHEDGDPWASIGITVNMIDPMPYLQFNYTVSGTLISYRVRFAKIQSNLGFGSIWYFVCPSTGLRCRVLYRIGSYFLHRKAFEGAVYERQTRSKSSRSMGALVDIVFAERPSRSHYGGKPTKRFERWRATRGRRALSLRDSEFVY